jgi:regulator of sigma E protease
MPSPLLAALDAAGVVMTVIGLGALIFFHELGHFLACRWTGTRVEAFSIGFGPELFGWTRDGIRYRIAAVPLGGYVKMAAENPGDARTDDPAEFPNKSFSARLFIMSNGVVFNLILAFVFFVWAFGIGVPFETPELGAVAAGEPAWQAGLRKGDVVTHVDGKRIYGFTDLKTEVAFSGVDQTLMLTVLRDGKEREVAVQPRYSEALGMPAIGVQPKWSDAAAAVEADSPVAKAGGRAGDTVLAVDGHAVSGPDDIAEVVTRLAGQAAPGTEALDLKVEVERVDGTHETLSFPLPLGKRPQLGIRIWEGRTVHGIVSGSPAEGLVELDDELVTVNGEPVADLGLLRDRTDGEPLREIVVRRNGGEVTLTPSGVTVGEFAKSLLGRVDQGSTYILPRPGMAAERAGLLPGDKVTAVGETNVRDWEELVLAIRKAEGPVALHVVRAGGEERTFTVNPSRFPKELFGYQYRLATELVRDDGFFAALATGWRRTTLFVRTVTLTIRSLVTRRVSSENIGGPIALASVTYQMFDLGFGKYLYILAIISVNLAILNMLPIPVLDGGQIVLLFAEKIRGKPLPENVVGYFQLVGLVLILGLMVLAFRNDIVNFILQ